MHLKNLAVLKMRPTPMLLSITCLDRSGRRSTRFHCPLAVYGPNGKQIAAQMLALVHSRVTSGDGISNPRPQSWQGCAARIAAARVVAASTRPGNSFCPPQIIRRPPDNPCRAAARRSLAAAGPRRGKGPVQLEGSPSTRSIEPGGRRSGRGEKPTGAPSTQLFEPGCCRTPPPSSRRQRRAPRARTRGFGAIEVNAPPQMARSPLRTAPMTRPGTLCPRKVTAPVNSTVSLSRRSSAAAIEENAPTIAVARAAQHSTAERGRRSLGCMFASNVGVGSKR